MQDKRRFINLIERESERRQQKYTDEKNLKDLAISVSPLFPPSPPAPRQDMIRRERDRDTNTEEEGGGGSASYVSFFLHDSDFTQTERERGARWPPFPPPPPPPKKHLCHSSPSPPPLSPAPAVFGRAPSATPGKGTVSYAFSISSHAARAKRVSGLCATSYKETNKKKQPSHDNKTGLLLALFMPWAVARSPFHGPFFHT